MINSIPVLLKLEEMLEEFPFEIWRWREEDLEGVEMGGWWEKSWGWIILVELSQPLVRARSLLEH